MFNHVMLCPKQLELNYLFLIIKDVEAFKQAYALNDQQVTVFEARANNGQDYFVNVKCTLSKARTIIAAFNNGDEQFKDTNICDLQKLNPPKPGDKRSTKRYRMHI